MARDRHKQKETCAGALVGQVKREAAAEGVTSDGDVYTALQAGTHTRFDS